MIDSLARKTPVYNKLFSRILDSSVWLLPHATRIVWITFLASMDEDGFCQFAAVQNLANRAIVTLDEAQAAVTVLEGPDLNSTDQANEGRRIERVPGGWMVRNAGKYREIATREQSRQSNRKRAQEFRDRQKSTSVTDRNGASQIVTPSEAVSEADKEETPTTGPPEKSASEESPDTDAEHMNWLQLAHKVIEDMCLPENPGTFQAIAGAIKYLVMMKKKAKGAAVQFLIAQCKDAQDRNEILNRFWFDDRGWEHIHEKFQGDHREQGTGPRPGGNRGTAANGFNRESGGGGKQYERPPDFTFK